MNSLRHKEIQYVKGIGPQRAELLTKQLEIRTAYDLLHHFPTSYVDRTTIYRIRDIASDEAAIQLYGKFVGFSVAGEGAKTRLVGVFTDGTGSIEVVWFNAIKHIRQTIIDKCN